MSEPNTIGAPAGQWPGLAKVLEESAELSTILAQLIAFPGGYRPDGKDLIEKLHEEVADLEAALHVFRRLNADYNGGKLDTRIINDRILLKVERLLGWHQRLTGIPVPTEADHLEVMAAVK